MEEAFGILTISTEKKFFVPNKTEGYFNKPMNSDRIFSVTYLNPQYESTIWTIASKQRHFPFLEPPLLGPLIHTADPNQKQPGSNIFPGKKGF